MKYYSLFSNMVLKIVGLHYTSTAPITSDLDIKCQKREKSVKFNLHVLLD